MNLLCDGPDSAIVETGWSIYPLWYSGDEINSMVSYEMIKDAIEQSNSILANEIQLAKRFNDTRRIGKFLKICYFHILINIFSVGNHEIKHPLEINSRSTQGSWMYFET